MTSIISNRVVVETGFWPLSSIDLEFFRATFVFTYFLLYGSSATMRDQNSQFVPIFGLHVAGENKYMFLYHHSQGC